MSLEVQLDAVALRVYSLPALVNVAVSAWTWVATLAAAALGFWRFRAVGSKSDASPLSPPSSFPLLPAPPFPDPSSPADSPPSPPATDRKQCRSAAQPPVCRVEEANATKARFRVYYHGGLSNDEKSNDEEEEEEELPCPRARGIDRRATVPWSGDWRLEGLAGVRRRWDLGWYRCQDMTALHGNVVRLWDGGDGGLRGSVRRRSRSSRTRVGSD